MEVAGLKYLAARALRAVLKVVLLAQLARLIMPVISQGYSFIYIQNGKEPVKFRILR